jgi:hypothetical protein
VAAIGATDTGEGDVRLVRQHSDGDSDDSDGEDVGESQHVPILASAPEIGLGSC